MILINQLQLSSLVLSQEFSRSLWWPLNAQEITPDLKNSLLFQAALLSQLAVTAAEIADDWSEKSSWIAVPNLHSGLLVSVWSISLCAT